MGEPALQESVCEDAASFLLSSFDYLIIGGGTAGLVLAARLTENPNIQVGVLEAGKLRLDDPNIQSMGGMSAMLNNPDYDWAFKTVPQRDNNGRIHHLARGKVIGGSSAINFMAYVRPAAADIKSWSMEGWSWDDLEPYYHKSEASYSKNSQDWPESYAFDRTKHGNAGAIQTSFPVWRAPIEDSILKAFAEQTDLPYPPQVDPWSGSHLGFFESLHTVDRSQAGKVLRSYAASGYLAPILGRKNLKILTEATVCHILLEKYQGQLQVDQSVGAKGVRFEYGGSSYDVFASHEVILCCSTIQSPRLLELSGIGNPEILSAAGIDCVVNLPNVGENLQEHPMTAVTYELTSGDKNENITLDSLSIVPGLFAEQQRLLVENQTGILASPGGLMGFVPYATQVEEKSMQEIISNIRNGSYNESNKLQQIQTTFITEQLCDTSSPTIQLIGLPGTFDIANGASDQSVLLPGPRPGSNACYTVLISTMYPLSRGSTHITSSSKPLGSSPRIDLGILSHWADLDVLAVGLRFVDRILSPSSPDQSTHVRAKISRRIDPSPEIDVQEPEQTKNFIRDRTMVFNHILGTCAMGQVVDARLRVKGVARLRVVDASVIPAQISGNIIATVYAIAEMAADLIKADY